VKVRLPRPRRLQPDSVKSVGTTAGYSESPGQQFDGPLRYHGRMTQHPADGTTRDSISSLLTQRRKTCTLISLELGCGNKKMLRDSIGIDIRDFPPVDLVGDACKLLSKFPDGSVDEIHSSHFLEHLDDVRGLLLESARVLKPQGTFFATVPHFSNPFYYSDPTHRTPFGLYTPAYFVARSFTRRQVPIYEKPVPLSYISADYHFKSHRPHYVRHAFKQFGRIFNFNDWTKEWYEERWVWLVPAHEIRYTLVNDCR